MLTEQRYEQILKLLEKEGSITVTEVKELLNISESTVRRDITALHNAGKLVKVFGGAVASDHVVTPQEPTVAQKITVHVSENRSKVCSITRRRSYHESKEASERETKDWRVCGISY